jgi:ABC-type transport system substrate-binding protein
VTASTCVCLISRYTLQTRPMRVTYYIRKNAKWSDGVQVTGKDWRFTWQTRFITNTPSEIQAIRSGEVDAIYPQPQLALADLRNQSGLRVVTHHLGLQ